MSQTNLKLPPQLARRRKIPLRAELAQQQLEHLSSVMQRMMAVDNLSGPCSEEIDLDPREGHVLLRNDSREDEYYPHLEVVEARYQGDFAEGQAEIRYQRFDLDGHLDACETITVVTRPARVDHLRVSERQGHHAQVVFCRLDRYHPEDSFCLQASLAD
jgi:hypothetical protein